jgi:predicted enzyme related to lactoylglutathione lyase
MVVETFFSLPVLDMERATSFYTSALGAKVAYATPRWTSLHIAGVRIGLFLHPMSPGGATGLHFVVPDLAAARAAIEQAGGHAAAGEQEVAPGVVTLEATDTEENGFTLRRA